MLWPETVCWGFMMYAALGALCLSMCHCPDSSPSALSPFPPSWNSLRTASGPTEMNREYDGRHIICACRQRHKQFSIKDAICNMSNILCLYIICSYTYTYLNIHIHIYMYVRIHTCMYHIHTYIHIHIYTGICRGSVPKLNSS